MTVMNRFRPLLAAGLALLATACASSSDAPPKLAASTAEAAESDLLVRLADKVALYRDEAARRTEDERVSQQALLMNNLEHLLPSWHAESLAGNAEPLERVLLTEVVTHFDLVEDAFLRGTHERRLVAAWALGFSRVPPNDRGVRSRHDDAIELLNDAVERADDDVLRNMLLAYWKLGDARAPIDSMRDMIVQHHDAEIRAAAALALGTSLATNTAERAVDSVLVALDDTSGKVRLHAAKIAWHFPHPAYTSRMSSLVVAEPMPLVQAAMARALGASGDPGVEKLLVNLLDSRMRVVSTQAHAALIELTGRDEGPTSADWRG